LTVRLSWGKIVNAMNLHEHQAKTIFARYGIPVPDGHVARTADEAADATSQFGGRAAIKAQVHAGGRGLAGGVKVVGSPEEAREFAGGLLGSRLVTHQTDAGGVPVDSVLVEELADISSEMYVALTVDRDHRGIVFIASAAGGTSIEEVAASNPAAILTEAVEPVLGLMPYQCRRLAARLGLTGASGRQAAAIFTSLYQVFTDHDCTLVEVNPLITTGDGGVVALDAKMNVEDDALFRHSNLVELRDRSQENVFEAQAADDDIAYVNLDGSVGCLVNGAGLAMATLDVANAAGAAPANFLDVGGGASEEKVAAAVSIILSDPKVDRVLVNIFGGILRCDVAARGIVMAFAEHHAQQPLVVRMLGTNLAEGKNILAQSGLNVTFTDTLTEAAAALSAGPAA
jgi:succinyl-CoA synthetase beta subunit